MPQILAETLERERPAASPRAWLLDPSLDAAFQRLARLSAAVAHSAAARVRIATTDSLPVRSSVSRPGHPAIGDGALWRELAGDVARTRSPVAVGNVDERRGGAGVGVAFLGVPLLGRNTEVLGTLTVIDDRPRLWQAEEIGTLVELAALAMAEIEQRPRPAPPTGPAARPVEPPSSFPDEVLDEVGALWQMCSSEDRLTGDLREMIAGAVHVGSLHVGDRLPSIRRVAKAFGVTSYAVLQAYTELEAEGLVERRERSGIFVAPMEHTATRRLPEAADWLASVVTQACELQLKVPLLPDLVRRWSSTVTLRCACVESCADNLVSLCQELEQQFGVSTVAVDPAEICGVPGEPVPAEVRDAHFLVTTAFHARQLRPAARRLGKPLLVATANPLTMSAVFARLQADRLTVVCADARYGERLLSLHGGRYRDRIRLVLADDADALARLDRSEPVLLTLAARQRMRRADFRMVAPHSPAFSLDFSRKVSEVLVHLHVEAERA